MFGNLLERFDLFPKTDEQHRQRTLSGGTVSLISLSIFIVFLFLEFFVFLSTGLEQELVVDAGLQNKLNINIDITFPALPCSHLSFDAVDASGQSQLDLESSIRTQRLDKKGRYISQAEEAQLDSEIKRDIVKIPVPQNQNKCASCYGAETEQLPCCETCDDVREAYRNKGWAFSNPQQVAQCHNEGFTKKIFSQKNEGCRVYGSLTVSKTAGNFHISPGRSIRNSHSHIHDTAALGEAFNMTHRIDLLSFGPDFPRRTNPLDGLYHSTDAKNSLYQYFVKVVPTSYEFANGDVIETNQFSATQHFKAMQDSGHNDVLPGIFFIYDSSPIKVVFKENSQSFAKFLTTVCATAGGIFTISTLADWAVYRFNSRKV